MQQHPTAANFSSKSTGVARDSTSDHRLRLWVRGAIAELALVLQPLLRCKPNDLQRRLRKAAGDTIAYVPYQTYS